MKFNFTLFTATGAGVLLISSCSVNPEPLVKPNIIYILADDLGYGDLGCYGQQLVKTPNIDRMASEGMLFTQHYSGNTVCAPARSRLMTGQHTGNTFVRGNQATNPSGLHLPTEIITVADVLKDAGYVTGAFGKWSLGLENTEGHPNNQGFDEFFGYLSQLRAHRYYPDYLDHNDKQFPLKGNDGVNKVTYAPDVIHQHTLDFIQANKDTSFFIYVPMIIPHAELIAPEDSFMQIYKGKFSETPWGFDNLTENVFNGADYGSPTFRWYGYAPQAHPRTVFAAMVSRMDHYVGEMIKVLEDLGISDNTIIMFSSDNGPHLEGGADPDFFNSNGPFRGYKRDLYEGGIRMPMVVRWPAKIKMGSVTDHISAFWDILPTLAEIASAEIPDKIDGISFLPTLLGEKGQQEHNYLYWEFHHSGNPKLALRKENWKAVRTHVNDPDISKTELYDLSVDLEENINLASKFPEIVKELEQLMRSARTVSPYYDFQVLW